MAKKTTGKELVKWNDRLAQYANETAAQEAHVSSGGSFISTRGGRLSYKDQEFPDNELDVVVLDHIAENHYYADRYDPDAPASPVCFAFGRDVEALAPHEKAEEAQSDACTSCPLNQFGTAETGRGKACKNVRRMAVIPADQLDNIADAEVAFLKVPVMSVKGWAGYVRKLATQMQRPPFSVITRIKLVPDPKSQFRMEFQLVEEINDDEALTALDERRGTVSEDLQRPYERRQEEPVSVAKKGGRGAPARGAAPVRGAAPARGAGRKY